jgi:hypothetical protein
MSRRSLPPRFVSLVAILALACALRPRAAAYEPATHAGLTESAALASSLHRVLKTSLGRSLGLYEPLQLTHPDHELELRLSRLDPEGGYAADNGRQSALGWLLAGAVVEGVPPIRLRHHFYDPSTEKGLTEGDAGGALGMRIGDVARGIGSVRGIFTGANFDGTGRPSVEWMTASGGANDWGLQRFLDERERAVAAARPLDRDAALARALLAAGAILHLVEDAGDPALVRNDYRVALDAEGGPYERYVAERYGRLGLPAATQLEPRTHLVELVHHRGGDGLADRTQARFFSPGTLPDTRRYSQPQAVAGGALAGYSAGAVKHLVAYHRVGERVLWSLDERCHRDYAEALLPEVGAYARAALELLFRGELTLERDDTTLSVRTHGFVPGMGTITLFADDAAGQRRAIQRAAVTAGQAEDAVLTSATVPTGTRRVAALFRGVDAHGEPIVVSAERPIK